MRKLIGSLVVLLLLALVPLVVSCGGPDPVPAEEEAPVLTISSPEVSQTDMTVQIEFSNADRCCVLLQQEDEAAPSLSFVLTKGSPLSGTPSHYTAQDLLSGVSYVLFVAAEGPGGQVMKSVGFTTDVAAPVPLSNHTMLLYMMGSGTGLESAMDANLSKVISVARNVLINGNRLMVFYDRGNYTRLSEIVIENNKTKQVILREYNSSAVCSADADFMKEVFKLVKEGNTSESYGLVLSSHGGGWIPSDMFDLYMNASAPASTSVSSAVSSAPFTASSDASATTASSAPAVPYFFGQAGDTYMEIPALAEALSDFHTDYIIFDACLMASVEALYDLRNTTDYIIASPIEVLSDGFPFKEIIPNLFIENHNLKEVCQNFMDYYCTRSGAISLIKTDALEGLAASVKNIVTASAGKQVNADTIQGYEGMDPHIFYDLEQYMQALTSDKTLLDAFSASLGSTVLYQDHTATFQSSYGKNKESDIYLKKSCGLSCYIKSDLFPQVYTEYLKTSWAKAIGLQ